MRNYLKMTLFVFSALFLLLLASFASAYPSNINTYTDRDTFSYNENVDGNNRGFSLAFTDRDSVPVRGYGYCKGYDYYDWSYGGKKCASSRYYDPYYADMPYYSDNAYNNIDHNTVLKDAFKTYRESKKQEAQLEAKRIALEERKRYSYGGYGYGYSGARYYRYGW
ncbi:hypothetical protein J4423_03085 [Candidatus Pacearchaeota archaeon]|nr:hypothetical protein [Candidatus Pacearchaeota archaeon]